MRKQKSKNFSRKKTVSNPFFHPQRINSAQNARQKQDMTRSTDLSVNLHLNKNNRFNKKKIKEKERAECTLYSPKSQTKKKRK